MLITEQGKENRRFTDGYVIGLQGFNGMAK